MHPQKKMQNRLFKNTSTAKKVTELGILYLVLAKVWLLVGLTHHMRCMMQPTCHMTHFALAGMQPHLHCIGYSSHPTAGNNTCKTCAAVLSQALTPADDKKTESYLKPVHRSARSTAQKKSTGAER